MLAQLRARLERHRFSWSVRRILNTAPITLSPDSGLAVLSQLQHKDILLYLLAIKSFARRVPVEQVYVLNDGTLTRNDLAIVRDRLPTVHVLSLQDHRSHVCPTGGCWERLLAISEFVQTHYVIQLDSDTLTLGTIPEVRNAVASQTGFALGTWDNQEFEDMPFRAGKAKARLRSSSQHVQLVAEANFDYLQGYERMKYVRGCAGFAGFPARSFSRDLVESLSSQMLQAIGDKWREWGSEQVMSNIIVANLASAVVLPHPKYADCLKMHPDHTEFVHFIGTCRFKGNRYGSLGRGIVRSLA